MNIKEEEINHLKLGESEKLSKSAVLIKINER